MVQDVSRACLDAAIERGLERAEANLFRWGVDDCALWCADVLRDALHVDAAEAFRGRYDTRDGAYDVLGPLGLALALARAARRNGWARIHPSDARIGDLGLAVGMDVACVLKYRGGFWVGRDVDHSWVLIPEYHIRYAWCVL